MIKEVTDNNFLDEVSKNETPVVVDFWAPGCAPCKMLSPVIEEISKEMEGKVKFVKINVDENPLLSQKYRILNIPTVMLFNKGVSVDTMVGFRSKQDIKRMIQSKIK